MLKTVMPKRGTFFQLLASHTDRLVGGATATMRLLTALGAPGGQDLAALIDEVNVNENSADDIKAQYIRLLYESFTTPLNRQQMHTLMKDLDRVLDTLQSVANAVRMYQIESSTSEARVMASLGADACTRLHRAVVALADRKRQAEVTALCHEVEALEDRGVARDEDAPLLHGAGGRPLQLQAGRAHDRGDRAREPVGFSVPRGSAFRPTRISSRTLSGGRPICETRRLTRVRSRQAAGPATRRPANCLECRHSRCRTRVLPRSSAAALPPRTSRSPTPYCPFMRIVCLDLEGVLVPEIWIEFAQRTGIPELRRTTRDEPDYDKLMKARLAILKRHGLGIAAIQDVIAAMGPMPGARDFLDALRGDYQVIILSDTFYEFARPLMRQLGLPTLFCHSLVVDDGGMIADYRLRMPEQKREAVTRLKELNFRVVAAGDSYNDTAMLAEAHAGILFHPPENVIREFPQFPVTRSYDELRREIDLAFAAG